MTWACDRCGTRYPDSAGQRGEGCLSCINIDTPTVWWGPCPFCGAESEHTMGTAQECGRCGFRFRILPWPPQSDRD